MSKKHKLSARRAQKSSSRSGPSTRRAVAAKRPRKCPVAGCRNKTKGPRYNYFCEGHKGRSGNARREGLISKVKRSPGRRTSDRQARKVKAKAKAPRKTATRKPRTPKLIVAKAAAPYAKTLETRCTMVLLEGAIGAGGRCALNAHPEIHHIHIYAPAAAIPVAARTLRETQIVAAALDLDIPTARDAIQTPETATPPAIEPAPAVEPAPPMTEEQKRAHDFYAGIGEDPTGGVGIDPPAPQSPTI